LNDDGVHLPVGIIEGDFHQRFGDAQVRRRADREKLGQAFHNAQQDGLNVYAQEASDARLVIRPKKNATLPPTHSAKKRGMDGGTAFQNFWAGSKVGFSMRIARYR
jgi:hypothetical protein